MSLANNMGMCYLKYQNAWARTCHGSSTFVFGSTLDSWDAVENASLILSGLNEIWLEFSQQHGHMLFKIL